MISFADIEAARARLRGAIYETPCPYSQTLSELTGTQCFVKLENLQMTGSFKERGAANLLLQLEAAELVRGVVTASAGNHGLAVAFHAARLGAPAVIVMPEYAPLIKVTSARHHRAEVILAGANFDEACAEARRLERERGLIFVHPVTGFHVASVHSMALLSLMTHHPPTASRASPGPLARGMPGIRARRTAPRSRRLPHAGLHGRDVAARAAPHVVLAAPVVVVTGGAPRGALVGGAGGVVLLPRVGAGGGGGHHDGAPGSRGAR